MPAVEAGQRSHGGTVLAGGRRYLVALIGFTTGAALVVHILTRIAITLAVVGVAVLTVGAFAWAWCQLPPTARSALRQRQGPKSEFNKIKKFFERLRGRSS